MDQHLPLLPDHVYHIFNRAIGSEPLFINDENYRFFLEKMKLYLLPVLDFYTYSLMPNHFHWMVRIKSELDIIKYFEIRKKTTFDIAKHDLPDFVMDQVGNCLNAYTKAFNRTQMRKGGLFIARTKRSLAQQDSDFTSFVLYVHKNAVHHGLTKKIGEWKHDAYNEIVGVKPTFLLRDELFEWFGSRDEFVRLHRELKIDRKSDSNLPG